MRFVLATLLKDLTRWRNDALSFAIYLTIPLVIGGLLTAMMDQDGGGPSGTLLIADLDDSLLSGFVAGAFSQDELGGLLLVQSVSVEEGAELIEAGEASGFLTIPKGFQEAFLNNTPVIFTLKTNPAQTILPGIIQNVTEILLDVGFYLQTVFGEEIAQISDAEIPDSPSDFLVSAMAVQINQKMQQLGPMLFPPLMELKIIEPPPAEPRPDIALLFLPGIVLMALLFVAQGLSSDYWKERELGTLRRLVSSPGLLSRFVLGKSLAAAFVIASIVFLTLLAGFAYHDVAWNKLLPSLLWVTLGGVGLFAWFGALQMLFPNNRAANLVTSILVFPLLMMGGSFFPLDVLPDWLAAIGRLSPNGFIVDRLTTEFVSVGNWTFDTKGWAILVGMALSGLMFCVFRLSAGFARR